MLIDLHLMARKRWSATSLTENTIRNSYQSNASKQPVNQSLRPSYRISNEYDWTSICYNYGTPFSITHDEIFSYKITHRQSSARKASERAREKSEKCLGIHTQRHQRHEANKTYTINDKLLSINMKYEKKNY